MNAYTAYQLYLGIKLHFTNGRSFVKYGVPHPNYQTFVARRDRFHFEKLSRKYSDAELKHFYIANFLEHSDAWVGDLCDESAHQTYIKWKKRYESLDYTFSNEVNVIFDYLEERSIEFDALFDTPDNEFPPIFQLLSRSRISPETYAILDMLLGFGKKFDAKYGKDAIWKQLGGRYSQYGLLLDLSSQLKNFHKIAREITQTRLSAV